MTDIFLTHEGDFLINADGDLQQVSGMEEKLQVVARLVKSPDDGTLGGRCSLYRLVGRLLTPEALRDGEAIIYSALAGSLALSNVVVEVRGIPVSASTALFVISLSTASNPHETLYTIPFDFQHGVIEPRDASTIGNSILSF